jgi:hypothetical protein
MSKGKCLKDDPDPYGLSGDQLRRIFESALLMNKCRNSLTLIMASTVYTYSGFQ